MVITYQANRFRISDVMNNLDAGQCFTDAEAVTSKDMLVTLCMQFCKAGAELKLITVDIQRTIRLFLTLYRIRRQALGVDAQEVAHPCFFQSKISCHTVKTHHMYDILLDWSEYPLQHIIEMNTDIGRYTTALVVITLPRSIIPLAT